MVNVLGFNIPVGNIDVTGFLASSWIYVFIVAFIGIILIGAFALFLFMITWNRKIIIFENIAGAGYQPVLRTRARIINLGVGGEEVLKLMKGKKYVTAYGRKMGRNTYWFAKGQDGYLYNCILGDLDAKLSMLDIEPVDRDVRMFHVALNKLSEQTYGKTGFLEKYAIHMMLFAFLLIMLIGFWVIAGKINEGLETIAKSSDINRQVSDQQTQALEKLNNLQSGNAGLVPADSGG